MKIKSIELRDIYLASKLVWDVFSEYVAPGYSQNGIETFRKFIQPEELKKSLESGKFFMLGCYDEEEKLVGVTAIRDLCHVSLLFVDKAYHGRGIAKELITNAINRCTNENPGLSEISVNSSIFAVEVYKKIGFKTAGEKTTKNGIIFLPMKMIRSAQEDNNSVRYISKDELKDLMELYKHLNKDDPVIEDDERLTTLWLDILNDPNQNYLVAAADGRLVSSCVLVIISNLTRGGRPYGLIENVVTHEDYRNKGYGTKLLKKALEIARDKGCYKVMLMSGRGEEVLEFYKKAGFEKGKKTGFIVRF